MDETSRPIMTKTNRSTDIIIDLKPREGEGTKNTSGITDNRLFTGENKLHAVMDTQNTLWTLRYEKGVTPEPFKGQWTSFSKILNFVKDYYAKRNIDVVGIID